MRKIKEVLRLQAVGLTQRGIARSLRMSHSTVKEYLARAQQAQLVWPLPEEVGDAELEARLFPPAVATAAVRPLPDWQEVHRELKSKQRTGVTLQLLWLEYKEGCADGLQYSQFCQRYRDWRGGIDRVMRQEHRAGEKVFVDFAGQTVPIIDRATGQVEDAYLFVGVLGASNYTYVEACPGQDLAAWIGAHVRMYTYFGGVPLATVPDNTGTAVRHACYYDPDLNPTYQEMAAHYRTAILPARVRKPRDKSKVENGVLVVERWILARLRKQQFFSLSALQAAIAPLLEALNQRPFQKLEGSRRSWFERLERPALQPLPAQPFELAEWRQARVNIDYHVAVLHHHYSAPHLLVGAQVEVRITATTVEILHDGRRVAAHVRSHRRGGFTTDPTHRPAEHRHVQAWPPERLVAWAGQIGPRAAEVVRHQLETRAHPEQGYRACLGLIRLAQRYSAARLEAACDRALEVGAVSYRSIKSILDTGLDRTPVRQEPVLPLPQQHAHLRGQQYYAEATRQEPSC
jgi:transposase